MNSLIPILLVLTLVLAGCLNSPEPRLGFDKSTDFKIDALNFEALKLWNATNQDTREIALDSCNNAKMISEDGVTWQITLNNC